MTDPRKTTELRRDFLSLLDVLRVRVRFRLGCLQQGRRFPETAEQLQWVLPELDRIQQCYLSGMPWPSGGLDWAVRAWPESSELRKELLGLEREYYRHVHKAAE